MYLLPLNFNRYLALCLFMCVNAASLNGQFLMNKTEDMQLIYYSKKHEYIVPHLTRCFMNSFKFHRNLFGYEPGEDVTILLQDFGDFGYGGADALPTNHLNLGINPFNYVYDTMPASERMNSLMHHELAHLVIMDMANKRDRRFRSLFRGKVTPSIENPLSIFYSYLTNPRRYSPRWYHEGFAVFMETWMSGGLGRVLGGYDEMVFRTRIRDNGLIYDMIGLESEGISSDFQVGVNSYLYGTRFISYIAYAHGIDNLLEWISRTDDSEAYFTAQFKKVYRIDIDDEWSNWIEWERNWQSANLDSINLYPVTPFRSISSEALGSVSRYFIDASGKKMYAGIRYPGQVAHIAAIDIRTGEIEKIHDIDGAALFYVFSIAFDDSSNTLFYTTNNNHRRDFWSIDLESRRTHLLIKELRAGDLVFNRVDKSIWGLRHSDGFTTIIRIAAPYADWKSLYVLDYGYDIYDLDISPNGEYLTAAFVDISGYQKLVRFKLSELLTGVFEPETIHDFDVSSPANFVYSSDGRYLYGSSYFTGVSNIFRYDFEIDSMEVISNCETGFFRPVPVSEDSIIVMRYTSDGFNPVFIPNNTLEDVSAINYLGWEIANRHPVVLSWATKAPLIDVDSLLVYSGTYNPTKNIRLSSVYPVVQGYKNSIVLGAHLDMESNLGLSRFNLSIATSPERNQSSNEILHVGFNFRTLKLRGAVTGTWKLSGGYNTADFYDLFGPTKRSRKGYFSKLQFDKSLITDMPLDLSIDIAGYGGLEKLPDYQNVEATFDRFLSSRVAMSHSKVKRSLGAVDDEKGIKWELVSTANYVNSKIYPRIHGGFDYGLISPIKHAPVWLRTSTGYSFADRDDPQANFANFYFGGFGNNWVDYLGVKRYREYYSFPGVDLNYISGFNFAKVMGEWILPPLRFRRVGTPMLYLNWTRASLFTSTIVTNLDDENKRTIYYNIGVQLDTRISLFSHLRSTLSVGYALAYEKRTVPPGWNRFTPEYMVSIQILQ